MILRDKILCTVVREKLINSLQRNELTYLGVKEFIQNGVQGKKEVEQCG
jgi:hypothetical protein